MVLVAPGVATGPVEVKVDIIRRTGSGFAGILGSGVLLAARETLVADCSCKVRLVVLALVPLPAPKLRTGAGWLVLGIARGEDREGDASSAALLAVSLSISARHSATVHPS
jgi:hypothetical protein